MVMVQPLGDVVAELAIESTTLAVKVKVPAIVGVPVIAPVDAFSVRPGGKEPELIENVYGGTPPVAFRNELYGTSTWPVFVGQASINGGGAIVIVHCVVTTPLTELPEESTTFAVKVKVPKAVGVPVMPPVVSIQRQTCR